MTIVEDACVITGDVDTHADAHVAAALDRLGGLLGVREFPATAAGYAGLLGCRTSCWPAIDPPAAPGPPRAADHSVG
jgi:hypothetical protein